MTDAHNSIFQNPKCNEFKHGQFIGHFMIKTFVATVLLMSFFLTSALYAQTAISSGQSENEETECILAGYIWTGTAEDVRHIKERPVPEGYLQHKSGACSTGPDPADLIRWHLRFGNEETTKTALQFIEKRNGSSDAIIDTLKKDLANALTKLNAELAFTNNSKKSHDKVINPDDLRSFISKSSSVIYLQEAGRTLENQLIDRIHYYLSAAEIFKSKTFLARAQTLFESHQEIEKNLYTQTDKKNLERGAYFKEVLKYVQDNSSGHNLTSFEIDLRLAVLTAQLNFSKESLDKARQLLERRKKSVYLHALNMAYQGGEDFCDILEYGYNKERENEVSKACKEEDNFENKVMAYGYAEAMLGILTDTRVRPFDWEDYEILHKNSVIFNNFQSDSLTGSEERIVDLKLALVDRHIANYKVRKNENLLGTAWAMLEELSPLANPAQKPVRFKKIAERAIFIASEMEKEDGKPIRYSQMLSYFRLNLENLEKLAGAQIP
jgi:hypothetical protein